MQVSALMLGERQNDREREFCLSIFILRLIFQKGFNLLIVEFRQFALWSVDIVFVVIYLPELL